MSEPAPIIPLLTLDTIDSTMLEAARQATAGQRGPFVVCARAQTGGVGRHGRSWSSPPGNLYWTILLDDPADIPRDAAPAFAAGLAIIDALAATGTPRDRLRLKWPNDILLDTRKLAGLLVEASLTGTQAQIIVGIGINLASSPPDAAYPATSLAEAALPVPSIGLIRDTLTDAFLRRRAQWHRTGLATLRDEAATCLHGLGTPTSIALNRDRTDLLHGINEGLAPSGGLRLRTEDGTLHTLLAGDVLA